MRVVSHKAIREFSEAHPESSNAIDYWYRVTRKASWASFADIKQTFNTADYVPPFVVFDIGGNKYRLVAEINFGRKVVFIRRIMPHKEYSKGSWKQ
jgi:mRNA interferase HigB